MTDPPKKNKKIRVNLRKNPSPSGIRSPVLISSNNPMYSDIWRDTTEAILEPIITRISVDVAMVPIRHVRVDEYGNYIENIKSKLHDRFNLKANIDQSGFFFSQEIVQKMLENGSVAIVPVDVVTDTTGETIYDILSLRVGIIEEWYNKAVKVNVYDENTGKRESIVLPKGFVSIVYNPLYGVMNKPNSTLKRLIDKRALLDLLDSKVGSSKLDLILQLPYPIKVDKQKIMAEERLTSIEEQLENSKYGIAYVDGTERITQLNRAVVNNLPEQVTELTKTLYNQLGLTDKIIDGTATPDELVSYYNRTISPILTAITSSLRMNFLSQTAITQGQDIMAFPNLFKMAPIDKMAEAADSLTRNEIMTGNEVRGHIGLPKSKDPDADTLRNKNLNKEQPINSNVQSTKNDEVNNP